MEKFDFKANNARMRAISDRLSELSEDIATAEGEKREALLKESAELREEREVLTMKREAAVANMMAERQEDEPVDKNAELHKLLQSREGDKRVKREITLLVKTDNAKNNITSAGAINLTVNDIMPDLDEGLIFGKVGLKTQTGVTGNIVWPYATSVVEMVEVGETVALTDQAINFDKIEVTPKRMGATIAITNEAIDDASFDLLGYVQQALTRAQQRQLNWKTFSFDKNITGLKGPFAGKTTIPTIDGTYKDLLDMKADIIDAGVDLDGFCWVLDAKAEALLKSTPKANGQGGFIIQDGKLDGDPYFVTHYIRQGASAKSNDMYIGCGVWSYFAANQHGEVRLVIDPYTKAVNNETVLTVNTRWSLTTLVDSAFAIAKIEGDDSSN